MKGSLDSLGGAFTHEEPQQGRLEEVIPLAIDQHDPFCGGKEFSKACGGHDAAGAASQHQNRSLGFHCFCGRVVNQLESRQGNDAGRLKR
jgi:hypothetical protein